MPVNVANQKAIDAYYAALAAFAAQDVTHEQATRLAFSTLLDTLAKTVGWTLVPEQKLTTSRKRPDGTLLDSFRIPRGYWEAKDTQDDLDAEIQVKIRAGYPLSNTIFEDTRRAVLYQNGRPAFEADLTQRTQLVALLNAFLGYTGEQIEEFHAAVRAFQERIPELAQGLLARIEEERGKNRRFVGAFEAFHEICKASIDPQIGVTEIEVMLVQHLLTERLFRTIFDNPDFTQRNVIAAEIEKVIAALTSRSFSRRDFLKSLDYFYLAIEQAAATITEFAQKQAFLNTVYERFFQGFSKDQADTHGIVYTPQPIVDFMVASVDEVLQREFGVSLSTPGVKILDPCTGTGNFVVNILRRLSRRDLKTKYREDLFANEIMLLPYYIAALNIEHAYYELTGEYEPFEGICFADTLDLAESQQLSLFAEENTERVERQKQAEITVIIGNPPYKVGQRNENDNNKNRKYPVIDRRLAETYVKDSKATLRNQLYDAYVRFFRWATDRLQGRDGVVCYVSNNSFVDQLAFDGMRKQLLQDFTRVYHLDLHSNVRKNPRLSGSTHNVFGIQVGVGVTIAIRSAKHERRELYYHRVPEAWTKHEKLTWLAGQGQSANVEWRLETIENGVICLTDIGSEKPFMVIATQIIPDLHLVGAGASTQCFPLYVYDEDGGSRRENITDWAMGQFQAQYGAGVTRRDIFHYVYAVLHHPQYRERYAENLKRELPRIPLVAREAFQAFVDAGARLAELHLGYEAAPEYPLRWVERKDMPFSWRVTKMKLTPAKDAVVVNESLTLAGIPPECFAYRLGNRSALEWVIDQYQVSTDRRSGISSDPNREDDEQYIARLVGRVVTVSVETVRLIAALPERVVAGS